jgi:class 3 adenylate cyclase/tetratricopeptide (TPR) repeat protein
VAPAAVPSTRVSTVALEPYLPRLVIEWLELSPDDTARTIDGTGVFADISGFTTLTELLSRRGKVGAEEMGDTLNLVFGALLGGAYEYGAGLVKWGGDAVLLLFQGDGHAARAAAAALEMQRVIARVGRIRTATGRNVRLRMSIGMHSGPLDLLLVGDEFRELVVTGPVASTIARMETAAQAGQVVVSQESAALIGAAGGLLGPEAGPGRLLVAAPPDVEPAPGLPARASTADLTSALPAALADHLLSGDGAYEHRAVAVCFVEFSGVDVLRRRAGLAATAHAVGTVVSACQRAATDNGVTFLASDIYPDGGKIILVAGTPRSAGDDTTRLFAAARQVLDSEQSLSLRAGLNVGRVFAGDYGVPVRRVYSITGDAVNLAARLMAKAGAGQLVASREALERCRTPFEAAALEPFRVKGKTALIEASVVGAARAHDPLLALPTGGLDLPLVGRDHELATLLAAYDAAVAGRGRLVDVSGQPGIGKSRLVRELLARAGEPTVLRLRGDLYATGTPYHPFHRLFASEAGDRVEVLRGLVERYAPHLLGRLPLLANVTGLDIGSAPEIEQLDPSARKGLLEMTISELLGLVYDTPTVWIFEDVQFMDGASTDLLDRLATDAHDRPWLVVATRRPEALWRPPEVAQVESLVVEPLPQRAADDLLAAAATGAGLPAHRVAHLVERAEGNPLFLTEMAASLRSDGDPVDLPDSVEGMVAARIDRLSPAQRSLLRTAAVLGMTPAPELLDQVVRAADGRAPGADLGALEEFLALQPDGSYRFTHHLVQEVAYEGLPFRRRVRLHASAADVIAGHPLVDTNRINLLSLHTLKGERYAEAYALSMQAGLHAAGQYANAEAAECYERVLAAARRLDDLDPHDLGLVWESLAEVYESLGDLDAMQRAISQARRRLRQDVLALGRLAVLTVRHRRLTGQHTEALRWATRGRRLLHGAPDAEATRLRAVLAERYALSVLAKGRFAAAERWAETAIGEAGEAGDVRTRARALEIRVAARSYAGQPVDLEAAAHAIELYEADDDLLGAARAHNVVGVVAQQQGAWPVALDHYRAAAAAYERLARPHDIALQHANTAEILIFQLRLSDAEEAVQESLRMWRGTRMNGDQAFTVTQQARLAMARSEYAAACRLFETARQVHLDEDERFEVVIVEAMLAECILLAGDPGGALRMIDDVQDRNREIGAPLAYVDRIRGVAQVASGDRGNGVATILASLERARGSSLYDEWRCLEALAELGAASSGHRQELARLRREVTDRLGVVLPRQRAHGSA